MAAIPFPSPAHYLLEAIIVSENYLNSEAQASLEDLYASHRDFLYRVALRVTRNADDAEDVVQNVFLRMMRNDARPDVGRSAIAYLKRAATNAAIDLVRQRAQRAETTLPARHPTGTQTFVEQHYCRQVLDRRPPASAQLFELHGHGYMYEELAERFGIQIGTVKSRLYRIRAALEKELQAA